MCGIVGVIVLNGEAKGSRYVYVYRIVILLTHMFVYL